MERLPKNSGRSGAARRRRPFGDIRRFVSRLFDQSLTVSAAAGVREYFMKLRLRVVGVFLMTFGVYSSLICIITGLFTSRQTASLTDAVVFGVFTVFASLPLLFSDKNVAASLTDSRAGSVVCDYLGIRRETLDGNAARGHASHGFIAGVVCGTLSFALAPVSVFGFILLAAAVCIIMAVPEAGLMLSAVLLLYCGKTVHCVIIGATLVSYLLKLIRGKRSFSLRRSDAAVAVFALCVLTSGLFSLSEDGGDIAVKLICVSTYFLTLLLYRSCRNVTKLITAAVISGGVLSAVYVIGRALTILLPAWLDASYLADEIAALLSFANGSADIILAALLPIAVGLALRHHNVISRFTLWMCAACGAGCLCIRGSYAHLAAAGATVALMLLLLGRRRVYLGFSILFSAAVLLMYSDGAWQNIYGYVFEKIQAAYSAANGIFVGGLTVPSSWFGGGEPLPQGANFYLGLLCTVGISGIVTFAASLMLTAREAAYMAWRTVSTGASHGELRRFGAIRSAADTRLGVLSPLAAAVTVLLCGTFANIWENDAVFMLLWTMMGVCSAYVRNADFEMTKAEKAASAADCAERSFCDIGTPDRI